MSIYFVGPIYLKKFILRGFDCSMLFISKIDVWRDGHRNVSQPITMYALSFLPLEDPE
jgi:hypothetical protein